MSEMIERVARALKQEIGRQLNAQPLPGEGNWTVTSNSWNPEGGTLNLSAMARAAITAMREPMDRMGNAAFEADLDIYFGYYIDGRPGSPAAQSPTTCKPRSTEGRRNEFVAQETC